MKVDLSSAEIEFLIEGLEDLEYYRDSLHCTDREMTPLRCMIYKFKLINEKGDRNDHN